MDSKLSPKTLARRQDMNKRNADYWVWSSKLECKIAMIAAARKKKKLENRG